MITNYPIPIIALGVSVIALLISTLNYRRKLGVKVRGSYSMTSSIDSDDPYISDITLENTKDKPVVIFSIYLRIEYNYYILIEEFEEQPLILKPYEVFQKSYGPIEFYGIGTRKIHMKYLLNNFKIHQKIVLSTSLGKYEVPHRIKRWDPVLDFFKNYTTGIVKPVRTQYKDLNLGGNIKYVVEITLSNGKEELIPIHSIDFQIRKFRGFNLTKESLQSAVNLDNFLKAKISSGELVCSKVVVYDLDTYRKYAHNFYIETIDEPKALGFGGYYLIARFVTWKAIRKQRKENMQRMNTKLVTRDDKKDSKQLSNLKNQSPRND